MSKSDTISLAQEFGINLGLARISPWAPELAITDTERPQFHHS